MLLKQIADRLTNGKALEPARFPGQIVLPRLCYKYNAAHQREWAGSSAVSIGWPAASLWRVRAALPWMAGRAPCLAVHPSVLM